MSWDLLDVLAAAVLLGGTALAIGLVFRTARAPTYRLAAITGVLACLALVWINAAVGLVGTAENDFNMVYNLIPLAGFAGAVIIRAKANGLAVTAIVLAAPMAAALAAGLVSQAAVIAPQVIGLHLLFMAGFSFAAWQFRLASRT